MPADVPSASGTTKKTSTWRRRIQLGLIALGVTGFVAWNIKQETPALQTETMTVEKRNIDGVHVEAFHSRKLQAAVALHVMEAKDSFTTEFSSRSVALQKGFPPQFQWKPCVLERIFQKKQQIQVTLVGGSTAARAPNNCTGSKGRYSNILQDQLHQNAQALPALKNSTHSQYHKALMQFQVHNMAKGGTNSVTNSLLIDIYINPNKTDIIIWDFLANGRCHSLGAVSCVMRFSVICIFILDEFLHA